MCRRSIPTGSTCSRRATRSPVGYVEEGVVRRVRDWPLARAQEAAQAIELPALEADWPRVEIVMSHAGASGAVIDALLRDESAAPVRGLVVASTGNGTVHHALEASALKARDAGVEVLRATRCPDGHILPRADDRLRDAGALTPVKARIALMLELLGAAGGRFRRADEAPRPQEDQLPNAASARWVISSTVPTPWMARYFGAATGSALAQAE